MYSVKDTAYSLIRSIIKIWSYDKCVTSTPHRLMLV